MHVRPESGWVRVCVSFPWHTSQGEAKDYSRADSAWLNAPCEPAWMKLTAPMRQGRLDKAHVGKGPESKGRGRAQCVNLPHQRTRTLCVGLKDGKLGNDRAIVRHWKTGTIVSWFGFEGVLFLWRDGKLGDNTLDGCPCLCPLTSVDDYSLCHGSFGFCRKLLKGRGLILHWWAYCSQKKKNSEFFSQAELYFYIIISWERFTLQKSAQQPRSWNKGQHFQFSFSASYKVKWWCLKPEFGLGHIELINHLIQFLVKIG